MDKAILEKLLSEVKDEKLSISEAMEKLKHFPYSDLGYAKIDPSTLSEGSRLSEWLQLYYKQC
jgi:hypothetical protein